MRIRQLLSAAIAAGSVTVLAVPPQAAHAAAGDISLFAGDGTNSYSGDSGTAASAQVNAPYDVAFDSSGNVYIADSNNHRIRKVTPGGTISTFAGTGSSGYSGDDGPATSAQLNTPTGIAFDSSDNLYIADSNNNRIRKVTPGGTISTVAGTGGNGYGGDSGAATSAQLKYPNYITVDASGNLYIADTYNHRVRKVTTGGTITTVAGTGSSGYSGDNGAGTSAQLYYPEGLATDSSGNLYIADSYNHRVRKLSTGGTITTVAGSGSSGYNGDSIAATAADINKPYDVALDADGNLYLLEYNGNRVRKVTTGGIITTFAGTGSAGYSGDGGAATSAQFYYPKGMGIDSGNNVFVADTYNHRVRKIEGVAPSPSISSVSPSVLPLAGSTLLTITGAKFATAPGDVSVTIGATPCAVVSATTTTVTCRAPSSLTTGQRDVVVTNTSTTASDTETNGVRYVDGPALIGIYFPPPNATYTKLVKDVAKITDARGNCNNDVNKFWNDVNAQVKKGTITSAEAQTLGTIVMELCTQQTGAAAPSAPVHASGNNAPVGANPASPSCTTSFSPTSVTPNFVSTSSMITEYTYSRSAFQNAAYWVRVNGGSWSKAVGFATANGSDSGIDWSTEFVLGLLNLGGVADLESFGSYVIDFAVGTGGTLDAYDAAGVVCTAQLTVTAGELPATGGGDDTAILISTALGLLGLGTLLLRTRRRTSSTATAR